MLNSVEEHGTSYSRLNQPKAAQDRRGALWFLRPSVSCPAFGSNINRSQQNKRGKKLFYIIDQQTR